MEFPVARLGLHLPPRRVLTVCSRGPAMEHDAPRRLPPRLPQGGSPRDVPPRGAPKALSRFLLLRCPGSHNDIIINVIIIVILVILLRRILITVIRVVLI